MGGGVSLTTAQKGMYLIVETRSCLQATGCSIHDKQSPNTVFLLAMQLMLADDNNFIVVKVHSLLSRRLLKAPYLDG